MIDEAYGNPDYGSNYRSDFEGQQLAAVGGVYETHAFVVGGSGSDDNNAGPDSGSCDNPGGSAGEGGF